MTIDFGLLGSQPVKVAWLLAGFLALKIFSLWGVAQVIEICRQRWLFAFLLSQGGEFAFVVFGVARAARLFTAEWEALLTSHRGALDGDDTAPAARPRQAHGIARQGRARARHDHRRRARDHRGLRALRADRRAPAARERRAARGARPRSRPGGIAAQVRLHGVLRRCDAAGPPRSGGRPQGAPPRERHRRRGGEPRPRGSRPRQLSVPRDRVARAQREPLLTS